MTTQEVADYKEQMFGNGQSTTQSQEPTEQNASPETQETPAETQTAEVIPINITPESAATPVAPTETPDEVLDENDYVKQRLGYDTWELAKADIDSLKQKAATPAEIKYANDQSKKLHEALLAGKEDDVYEVLAQKRQIERLEKLDISDVKNAVQVLKTGLQYKYKDLSPDEVDDLIQEQYTKPDKPTQTIENEDDYPALLDKWKSQCDAIDKKIIREAKIAKPDLLKYKTELVLPDIKEPLSEELAEFQSWKQSQQNIAKMDEETKEAYSKLTQKDVAMLFRFNDEASKLAFDIAYEPDKESFDKAIANASDLQTYFSNYYGEDGSPKRKEFLRDLYAGQNITKIVSEAVKQATNQTKSWFLKNQKNIGDGIQKNYVIPPTTDIDKLRQAVFG